jgi:adenosine deaminase
MRDLAALPKTNLHLHLTGAMRPATVAELAGRHGITLPALDMGTLRDHAWSAFQHRYDAARDTVRSAADITRIVVEAAQDDAAAGGGWTELQVDPTSYVERLGSYEAVLEAVLAGAAAAPVPVGVVVASSWARSGAHALRLARLAARYAGRGVVGFGLSNDERLGRVADFVPACAVAAEAGLLIAPHAGFYEPAAHVAACVRLLGSGRIGHGLSAVHDAPTLALLAERGVALELCPASYVPLGVLDRPDSLPVRALLAAGVPVVIGTDDPLLFGAGLTAQYAALGLTDAQYAAVAGHSITASAAPPQVKERLAAGVAAWFAGNGT